MINLTHFVVAPSIGTLFLRPQPLASSVGPKNPWGGRTPYWPAWAGTCQTGMEKMVCWTLGQNGGCPISWLSLAEWLSKIGCCGTIWVFLGDPVNKQTYLRHWWIMSISLQWIILYSYVWRIKISVGSPKDPHAGQFVHRLRGKSTDCNAGKVRTLSSHT